MEVCVDSIESAVNAKLGGAMRIELCSGLPEGGLTPSLGIFLVVKELIDLPIFCMIRPKCGYDFNYTENDIEAMKRDITIFKEHGADGFVIGCLTMERCVDEEACKSLLEVAKPKPVTFHMAFDYVLDPFQTLEKLVDLGFTRLLTSGQARTAEEGVHLLKRLIETAGNRIIIIPGLGISEYNLYAILKETNANEFHGSASNAIVPNKMNELRSSVSSTATSMYGNVAVMTDAHRVRKMVEIYNSLKENGLDK